MLIAQTKPVIVFAALCVCNCLAQSTPTEMNRFVGTWKENLAKRKTATQTITYERHGEEIKYTHSSSPDFAYSFTLDGREVPYPVGENATVSWKPINDHTWERRVTRDGKLASTDTLTVSPDHRTLTTVSNSAKSSGEGYSTSAVWERSSGDTGLIGTWILAPAKSKLLASTRQIELVASGLKVRIPDFKQDYIDSLDGRDNPLSGPTATAGVTVSSKRINGYTIEETWKRDGKVTSIVTLSVAEDAKTLTSVTHAPNRTGQNVIVYEKE